MNLLIEATFFSFKYITGIERHLFLQLELLEKIQLFDEIYLVVQNDIPEKLLKYKLKLKIVKIKNDSIRIWKEVYDNHEFDIVYSTFVPPPILPSGKPVIYVLHDPGRYIYPDMMQKEALYEHIRLFSEHINCELFYVVTVSESSRKDILKLFPGLEGRIFVVYNFIPESLRRLKGRNCLEWNFPFLPKNKFFLAVGRYIPTKNTLIIVKAFEKRGSGFSDYKLVIIGRKGWYRELENYLERNNSGDIIMLDYISDKDLFFLYKNSYAFISASIYEGFGLPLIEAKFCGCPKIFCSDIPVYREINIQEVIYFDPNNILDLVTKAFMKCIASSPNFNDEISSFSLDSVANRFKEVFNEVINGELS